MNLFDFGRHHRISRHLCVSAREGATTARFLGDLRGEHPEEAFTAIARLNGSTPEHITQLIGSFSSCPLHVHRPVFREILSLGVALKLGVELRDLWQATQDHQGKTPQACFATMLNIAADGLKLPRAELQIAGDRVFHQCFACNLRRDFAVRVLSAGRVVTASSADALGDKLLLAARRYNQIARLISRGKF